MTSRLIVLNGAPGAGKTTLLAPLARELGAIPVSKDAVKEALADAVAVSLPTRALGGLALDALWRLAAMIDGDVIIESVWAPARDGDFFRRGLATLGPVDGVEVFCAAPLEIMRERFRTRPRHAAHDDGARWDEWEAFAPTVAPVSGFPVVTVDTSSPVNIDELARAVRAHF